MAPSLRSCATARAFGSINFIDSTLYPYNYYLTNFIVGNEYLFRYPRIVLCVATMVMYVLHAVTMVTYVVLLNHHVITDIV